MSEESYQRNVRLGVTGHRTGTCLPASFDRISNVTGIKTETYELYDNLRHAYVDEVGDDNNYMPADMMSQSRDVFNTVWRDLGMPTEKALWFNANSSDKLRNYLSKLAMGGFRTAVYLDTGGLHAVGVQQLDEDTYLTKSTWSPFGDEPVSVSRIFSWLDKPARQRVRQNTSRKTRKLANIVAIPPEKPSATPPTPRA